MGALEWRPLLFAVAGVFVLLLLALGTRAQAESNLFQTIPTPTPPAVPTPAHGITPRPPEENPSLGAPLLVREEVSPQDVLPGEELQFRLWLTNTTASAVTGIALADPVDPVLDLLEASATQGAAEVKGQSLVIYVGTLEAGQTTLITIRAQVNLSAQPGKIILNQATVFYDGGEASSNVVAAGLPPNVLPATGQERGEP